MEMEWYILHTSFCLLLLLIMHQATTQSLSEQVTTTKITIRTTQPPLNGDHCKNSSTCAHLNNTECINNLCIEVYLGSNCSNVKDEQVCKDANAVCSNGICACGSNYYDDNGAESNGTCQPKVDLGSNCSTVTDEQVCKDPKASCSNSKCACGSDYYDDNGAEPNGTCQPKVDLGSNCSTVTDEQVCKDPKASCSNSICACGSDYYDDNGAEPNGTCQPKVDLGSNCSTVTDEQVCKDPKASCSNSKCACGSDYYDDNGAEPNGTCQPKVGLGSNCPQSDACITANASCNVSSANVSNICVCNMDYYDNNGIHSNGTCRPVSDLQVTSLNTGTINERSITIMWTTPTGKENFIDYFVLIYEPSDNTGSAIVKNGTLTNVTLENLVPGQKYKIRITSVNRQTALSERTTSITFYKISKPSMPGNLQERENIDVVSGTITLQWNISEGVVNGYAVSVVNETYMYNQSYSIKTAQQTFTQVRSGTIYRFSVYAVSGDNDTGVLNSDARTDNITTTVQIPNPPTNLSCLNPTDRTFNLTWMQPGFPNGDIISYIIVIQRTDPSQEQYNETSPGSNEQYTVEGLTAGSFYKFQVYTRNVLYTSILNATVASCQTSPQMAEMPAELQIKDVTSRSGNVTWSKPTNFSGVHYGYSLQISNISSCIREVILRCIGCEGSFPNNLSRPCSDVSEQNASSTALNGSQYYEVALIPDTNYTVDVAAITGIGIGHKATKYFATKEEAPSKPSISLVRNITGKTATVEWNMEVRPGQTNYTIIATGISPDVNRTHSVSGFDNRNYEFTDLEEYWNYSVIVQANTSIGSNQSDPYNFTTLDGPAGPVSLISIDKGIGEDTYVTAVVSWKLPLVLDRNGPIDKFYVQQNESNNPSISKILIVQSDEMYTANFSVVPDRNYTFMVRAANDHFNGTVNTLEYFAPAGPPVNTIEMQGIPVIPSDKFSSPSQTSFQIEINDAFFMDTKNGATKMKGLICCKECKNANSTIMKPSEIDNIKTYTQAQKFNLNQYRLPVPPAILTSGEKGSKKRRKRSVYNNVTVYHVGIESCANKSDSYFCNGPLNPSTSYSIIAFVCTSGDCTLSNSYGPFITLAVPVDKPFPVGAVAGGIVGGVAAMILIAVILLLLRRRSKKGKTRKRVDDDESAATDLANISKIRKQRPINLANFAEYVAAYHKDSNLKFSEEYDDLKTLSPSHSHEAADMEENRLKNRFVNILPFDHTRVKLRPIDDVSGSDYINANYLPGFSKTREYIACQGPIPATIDDHWRLIWEQNVRVIVMLTQYKEENRVKCEQYMPLDLKDPKQYGDLVVECLTYSSMNSFEYRTLKIRLGEKERTIKHFHFLSWRDYSANVQLDTMIDFIKKVRSFMQPPDVEGPMIIHCSAGVGRTGTYIAIDYAIQLIDKYGHDSTTLDIFNFVLKMRENRTTMVQTEQQYIFIHDCIKEYLDRFQTYENQAFSSEEENLYQNTAETMDLYQNVSFNSTQKTEL